MSMTILYEDNHLLIVEKPVNMPVQADASGDEDLLGLLKAYLKRRYDKPGDVYLGLVHRLDRPAGGCVAFARTSKAAARLSAALREGLMERVYEAVVQGDTPEQGVLVGYLLKDDKTNTTSVVPEGTPGAKRAELSFERAACADGLSLLRVKLGTGRSHQIRVQCAHAGLPLWGDARYGGGKPGEQLALWAASLSFPHPTKGEVVRVESRPPIAYPWTIF